MSRNGSGGYSLPVNSWNPAVNGVSATPADWQALIGDVAAAIQGSVASDGQTAMSGNLPMGGYRLTGAGAPSGAGMSLRWEQLTRGADIPSAATVSVPLEGQLFAVTGSTAITAINATIAGRLAYLKFDAGIVLTHSANLLMPSGVNVTTGADDMAVFVSVSAGVWRCVSYPRFESANYPSATEPTITWPYMTWADTGNMLLKRRNAAGTAWVTIGPLLTEMATKAAATAAGTSFVVNPVGNISATDVQGAIEELDAEKQAALGYTPVSKTGDTMSGNLGIGTAVYRLDGDIQGSAWGGGFLSSAINGKAAAGATVKHLSSSVEFSNVYLPSAGTYDLPADYVLTGVRSTGAGSEFVLRGRTLRNQ